MLREDQILEFAETLGRHNRLLYHACQLLDFGSYLELGGVPSRALLESAGMPFTKFQTDDDDRKNKVWDLVFANLHDFGSSFANGNNSVPNPYGPIVICINPRAMNGAQDVAVCLKSAGASGFDREKEALNYGQIDEIFKESDGKLYVKYGSELRHLREDASSPELSVRIDPQLLGLSDWAYVLVDPLEVKGVSLKSKVESVLQEHAIDKQVIQRNFYKEGRSEVYENLISEIVSLKADFKALTECDDEKLRNWAIGIRDKGLTYQFDRFRSYLISGTIEQLTK